MKKKGKKKVKPIKKGIARQQRILENIQAEQEEFVCYGYYTNGHYMMLTN